MSGYPEGKWPNGIAEPGTWHGGRTPAAGSALLSCPLCGRIASLASHHIAADGTVTPSVVCPYEGCTFHEFIWLKGWKP